jgi:DNA-binding CsgD family transcriptional regulator
VNHSLTARDRDVLRLISEGHTTAEIAERLIYSEPTIRKVIHHLIGTLGARNRPHAIAIAIRSDLI